MRAFISAVSLVAILVSPSVLAGETQATPPAPPASPPPAASELPVSPETPSDSFDLLPQEAKPDAATLARQLELEHKLGVRRTMLQLHQIGGFVTLAGLAATVVVGQLNYADKYGGGGDTGKYITAHEALALSTSAVFLATGLLAVLAPSPLDKPLRLDTATLHKISMGVATAAMASEIVLGILTARSESSAASPDYSLTQRNLAIVHQVIGYTALVSTAVGVVVLAF